MKQSAILDIFYGDKGSTRTIQPSFEISDAIRRLKNIEGKLKAKIGDEVAELLETYFEVDAELLTENIALHFAEGFKLGLRLGMECLEKS